MLLSFLFHHINSDFLSNNSDVMDEYFKYVSKRFKTIFPEDYKPSILNIQLCLIFDDGYYDFYHYAFPLLKKYRIKTILAVPTNYILENTNLDNSTRLSLKHSEMMEADNFIKFAPFCTWAELKEMSDSGLVKVASHGLKHVKLTEVGEIDLENELAISKKIIESRLQANCDCFVYPYTAFNSNIITKTQKYYDFNFGYGGIMNYKIRNGFINRVLADEMSKADSLFTTRKILGYYKRTLKSEFFNRKFNN